MTCADTSVIACPPVSGQGERGANRKKEGLEEEERGERGAAEVTGGGSPQRDSRRQNVSGSQRRGMFCMCSNPAGNPHMAVIEEK